MALMGTYQAGVKEYWFCPYCCETEETENSELDPKGEEGGEC